jgi:hypothetical protein
MFGSDRWVAAALGRSLSWLHANRDRLIGDGFPPKDPIVGLTSKAAVEKWIADRARKD